MIRAGKVSSTPPSSPSALDTQEICVTSRLPQWPSAVMSKEVVTYAACQIKFAKLLTTPSRGHISMGGVAPAVLHTSSSLMSLTGSLPCHPLPPCLTSHGLQPVSFTAALPDYPIPPCLVIQFLPA